MVKRVAILTFAVALMAMLGGCSKCGFWWDEWRAAPAACKGEVPK